MDTIVVIDRDENELPEQIKQFVRDLNYLRDEGYIDFVTEEDGTVRLIPA